MLRVLVCACALAVPLCASAFSGADLDKLCARTDVASQSACAAYIEGAADAEYNTIEAIGGTTGPRVGQYFCLAPDAPSAKLTQTVRSFMADNPDKLTFNASTVVALGLGNAFPCKGTQ